MRTVSRVLPRAQLWKSGASLARKVTTCLDPPMNPQQSIANYRITASSAKAAWALSTIRLIQHAPSWGRTTSDAVVQEVVELHSQI